MSDSKIITRRAYAKINLSLRLKGKREDGYHEIDTLMVPIGLADKIEYANSRTTTLFCDTPGVPTDESNLIMKAVRAFEARYGKKVKQKITLHKCIPHGAGLGGGSSDAATTLLVLNEKIGTNYSMEELCAMAAEIGSDVSFFLHPVPSRCSGRGEIITPEETLAMWTSPIVLLKPAFGASTADMYKRFENAKPVPAFRYDAQTCDGIEMMNDLECAAYEKFPFLGMMKNWLLSKEGVKAAMMTGSGSALFALTDNYEHAAAIAAAVHREVNPTVFAWVGDANPQR